ncbi:MAG TPA: sigma-70 family RNA polymerase sigma factor [Acidimicrobiia bacterium]|nr:sigma-70 family RNA polymerase sigma factor [Acidimicrobiia bacterium]
MTRHPSALAEPSVGWMAVVAFAEWVSVEATRAGWSRARVDEVVVRLFEVESRNLVRLARFFVDDRDAAEDLVQEAFIRLARSIHRIEEDEALPAYLRSIVLNLARDHNRRGLVSLRHRPTSDPPPPGPDEGLELREDQRRVIEALRSLPPGQRNCLVLRYYMELTNPEIARTLGVSVNTVKTQIQRGMASLEKRLASG